MEAVEFIKAHNRMCKKEFCQDCKIFLTVGTCRLEDIPDNKLKELVNIVEQWSKSHPQKTMMQDFFEKFPNAPKTENGTPRNICPSDCGYTNEPESYIVCEHFTDDCLKCWSRPLEES